MCESYENSKKSRHIDIKYHYIKDLVFKKLIKIKFIDTKNNISDIFTKALNKNSFTKFSVDLQVL